MPIQALIQRLSRMPWRRNFDLGGYERTFDIARCSEQSLSVALNIRGVDRPPAIIIHGVMPRSGSVYTGELLRLHPHICSYPNNLWEVPFLETTKELLQAERHFFRAYKQNSKQLAANEFLPVFGAGLIAYLYSYVPQGKTLLIKVPDVQYLNYFYAVFPFERPVLLLRDGRDLVNSTLKTWPQKKFSDVCLEWNLSAKMVMDAASQFKRQNKTFLLTRFEDLVRDPASFVREACQKFDLDVNMYPFESIAEIAVIGSSSAKQNDKVSWETRERPRNFNPVGGWKAWTNKEKRIFKKIAGSALVEAQYSQSSDW